MSSIQLFPHQKEALEQTEQMNRVAYYLDMGLGKTFLGSEKSINLGKNILLVCQKSKIQDWIDHFRNYYPSKTVTFNLSVGRRLQDFIEHQNDKDGIILVGIINYELAFRRKNLLELRDFTLMLDESSMVQNVTAKRSKFVLKLQPENVILLSGTPTSGKYENLHSQLTLLGWKISKELYWKQYIETEWLEVGDFKMPNVVGYKNVDRLKQKLRKHGAVFMKSEEVFDLPDQIYNKIMVPTSKEYKKFMKNMIITMDTFNLCEFEDHSDFYGKDITPRVELVGDTTLTKRLYARMLCGHYNKEKLEAFKDILESTSDRLVVFYNFNDELESMTTLIKDRPISVINGPVKDLEAYENYNDSITFVQYQAGAMGLNLQKANKIIYFTLPQSCEHYMQSQKRIHRIGQEKRCFYYYLLCRNSVEEDILKALERGVDYTDELFKEYESD